MSLEGSVPPCLGPGYQGWVCVCEMGPESLGDSHCCVCAGGWGEFWVRLCLPGCISGIMCVRMSPGRPDGLLFSCSVMSDCLQPHGL